MTNKQLLKDTLIAWLPLGAAIIGMAGIAYLTAQQNYRLNANDPQVQLSEELIKALEQGAPPEALLPQAQTDIALSLQPFGIIYSATGTPAASSAALDGKTPELPKGALLAADKTGDSLVTWQPQKGIRIAAVIKKYKGGYVLVGRNLREAEKRIGLLNLQIGVPLLAILILTFLLKLYAIKYKTKEIRREVHQEVVHDLAKS